MRITTWNCLGDFKRKLPALKLLHDPDIAIIQECSKDSIDSLTGSGYTGIWMGGSYLPKGHAVLWKEGWQVVRMPPDQNFEGNDWWIDAFNFVGKEKFSLVAVWAQSEAPGRDAGYVRQIGKAFRSHPEWFEQGDVIVAGDFNSGFRWDKKLAPENHTSIVNFLSDQGLISAYHSQFQDGGTLAELPTFHWRNSADAPFHIDYIFFPKTWMSRRKSVSLGRHTDWRRLSDHCPLTLELEDLSSGSSKKKI